MVEHVLQGNRIIAETPSGHKYELQMPGLKAAARRSRSSLKAVSSDDGNTATVPEMEDRVASAR